MRAKRYMKSGNPSAKAGVLRAHGMHRSRGHNVGVSVDANIDNVNSESVDDKLSPTSFTEDTAAKFGLIPT